MKINRAIKKSRKAPLVYILVLNWNRKDDTKECLHSLQSLMYSNFKIVVIDNGSIDGSVDFLKKLFPAVEFIQNSSNLGFARGNNVGIKYALNSRADYILLLNNDTVVSGNFLNELVKVAEGRQEIGMLGPKVYYYGSSRVWCAGGKILYPLGITWHIGNRRIDKGQYNRVVDTDYQPACALLVKRKVIEEVGMFDTRYEAYFEDTDWAVRAGKKGYRIVCVQQVKIWHKVSVSSGGGLTPFKAYWKIKSGAIFFKKYASLFSRITSIPFLVGYETVIICTNLLKGKTDINKAIIRGLLEVSRKAKRGRFSDKLISREKK